MRIAIEPAPLVLGLYAQVGGMLNRAVSRTEDGDPRDLGRRFAGRNHGTDGDLKRLIRAVHTEVKVSDKLLRKTADVWKLSGQTDHVELVVQKRGEAEEPPSYVLLRPDHVREILRSIRAAAEGMGQEERTLKALDEAAESISGRPGDYYTFGFDAPAA